MMKIMVSACLLGENCKYNGGSNRNEKLLVMNVAGENVDAAFRLGAEKGLELAKREKPDLIVLQSRSPSCGVKMIYDGSFSGRKIPGQGLFAEAAVKAGFKVLDIEDIADGEAQFY